jgi:hypothetical protein
MKMMTGRRLLRIAPRAAALTIAADPALEEDYSVRWEGPEPTVREDGDAIDVRYSIGGRLRALSPRRASLIVTLNPAVEWSLELAGGVSGLRADLGGLIVAGIGISGGATDLPQPGAELPLRVEGGVSDAVVRRPAGVPAVIRIEGGVRELRLDGSRFGAMGGKVVQRSGGRAAADVALHVDGGASGLTVGVSGQ